MVFLSIQQRLNFLQAALNNDAATIRAITQENQLPKNQPLLNVVKTLELPPDVSLLTAGFEEFDFPQEPPFLSADARFTRNLLGTTITRHRDIAALLEIQEIRNMLQNSPLFFQALTSLSAKHGQLNTIKQLFAAKGLALNNQLQALSDAIEGGNVALVQRLLTEAPTIQQLQNLTPETSSYLEAVLFQAISRGQIGILAPLLENANLRVKYTANIINTLDENAYANIENNTWLKLFLASKLGKVDEVRRMLTLPNFANRASADNLFTFQIAAKYGQLDVLKEEKIKKEDYYTLLKTAIANNQEAVSKHLFSSVWQNTLNKNNIGELFTDALKSGNDFAINKILSQGNLKLALLQSENHALFLQSAVNQNRVEPLKKLLAVPVFANHLSDNDNSLFWGAIYHGASAEIIDVLMSIESVRTQPNFFMFQAAIGTNNNVVLQKLLAVPQMRTYFNQHAADLNNILLKQSMINGNAVMTRELLNIPGVKAQANNEILVLALSTNQVPILNELLRLPEYQRLAGGNNNALLKMALANGQQEIVAQLMQLPDIRAHADFNLLTEIFTARQYDALQTLLTFPEFQRFAAQNNNQLLLTAITNRDAQAINLLMAVGTVQAHIGGNRDFYVGQNIQVLSILIQSKAFRDTLDEAFIVELYRHHGVNLVSPLLDYPDIKTKLQAGGQGLLLEEALKVENDMLLFRKILTLYEANQSVMFNECKKSLPTPARYIQTNIDALFSRLNKNELTQETLSLSIFFSDMSWNANNLNDFLTNKLNYIQTHMEQLRTHQPFLDQAGNGGNFLLQSAIAENNTALVTFLLQLDTVKNNANFDLLNLAILNNSPFLPTLLGIPQFARLAASNNNALLKKAAEVGNLEITNQLLAINEVKQAANFETLLSAAQNHHFGVLNRLLEIDQFKALAPSNNNQLLRMAIQELQGETVEKLLALPEVARNANPDGIRAGLAANNVTAALQNQPFMEPTLTATDFRNAITNRQYDRAIQMLDIPEIATSLSKDVRYLGGLVFNPPSTPLRDKFLITYLTNQEVLFALYQEEPRVPYPRVHRGIQTRQQSKLELFNHLDRAHKIDGLPLTEVFDNIHWTSQNLDNFLRDPVNYISQYVPNFSPMKKDALNIKHKAKIVQLIELAEKMVLAGTAHDLELEALSNSHFEQNIVPAFRQRFREWGGSNDETICVENIEKQIRNLILDKIVTNAGEQINDNGVPEDKKVQARAIITFITNNRNDLLPGTNRVKMEQARALFNSNIDTNHIAWRAYDTEAATRSWSNLLTPISNYYLYEDTLERNLQTRANPEGLTFRKRVAYYFLAATDERLDCEWDKTTRIANFIATIAEIRRAHNEGSPQGRDNPSCTAGHRTRIAESMGRGHPVTTLPPRAKELLVRILTPYISQKLTGYIYGKSQDELKILYDALSLTKINLVDVLSDRSFRRYAETGFTPAHSLMRQNFMRTLGSVDQVIVMVNTELTRLGSRILNPPEKVFIEYYLTDFSSLNNLAFLQIVDGRIEHDPPDEIAAQAAAPVAAAAAPVNPYQADLDRLTPMLGANPAVTIRTRAANLTKKRDIFNGLLPKVEQTIEQLQLQVAPADAEIFKINLTKALVDEISQTWTNTTMVIPEDKVAGAVQSFDQDNPNFAGIVDSGRLHQQINNLPPAPARRARP